jgi:hypothetical protein
MLATSWAIARICSFLLVGSASGVLSRDTSGVV